MADTARMADHLRERRIKELSRLICLEIKAGNKVEARRLFVEMQAAVLARSPSQIQLMESAL
jgi:hypothetical protein